MQKLKKHFKLITIFIVIAILIAGCTIEAYKTTTKKSVGTELNELNQKASWNGDTFLAEFDFYDSVNWEKANGWTNGWPFDCTWYDTQVTVSSGTMTLILDDDPGQSPAYKSGEYRSRDFFGYGYYEVKMKATKNIGVVSSFFTYTGPSDGNPWDEIDIEFLGKDTSQVQFNYYTNGQGNHEHMHNLGFDAAANYHVYGFDWQANYITWYVDGVAVYTATENLPSTPSKIMMNLWPGTGVDEWLGAYNGATPLYAYYDYVKYSPTVTSSSSSSISSSSSSISSSSSSSYNSKLIPGKIEAENYDNMSGIQTEDCSEGTLNVGWIDTGDWMEYEVYVDKTANYEVTYRVANLYSTGKIDFIFDNNNLKTSSVPNTGGWQIWDSITFNIDLTAGNHTIRLYASGSPWNINWFELQENNISSSSSSSSSSSVISSSSSSSNSSSSSSSTGEYTSITVPYVKDGSGEYYWKTNETINYINSWNLDLFEINGMDITNTWTSGSSLPPKQDGYYYIHYKGGFGWSHAEIK